MPETETIRSVPIKAIDFTKCYFNPGCAMSIYKPELIRPMLTLLQTHYGDVRLHTLCCQHEPGLPKDSTIVNNCAGCDRRFRSLYAGIQTITFWELIDAIPNLPLPQYPGPSVSVHDSCSFRKKPQVHQAVRSLVHKMGIKVVESAYSGTHSICCGDNFYGHIPDDAVAALHAKRAAQMPCDNVVVYCIGCVRSMSVGGKQPLYLPELIFGRETPRMTNTLREYHEDLARYQAAH